MRRRAFLLGAGTATATALAGCGSTGGGPAADGGDGSTTVEDGPGESRTVIVTQSGEVEGDPDLAVIRVGIEVTGEQPGPVRSELAERSDRVRSALREFGIPEDAITTERFNIDERLDREAMEADGVRPRRDVDLERYRYYVGVHTLSVDVETIGEAGEVVDVAVDAGATAVDRVTYTLSDEKRKDLQQTATRRALRNARSEADAIAEEVDGRIVEATVVDASEGGLQPVTREVAAGAATPTPAPTPAPPTRLEPGRVTVTARVTVRYRMQ